MSMSPQQWMIEQSRHLGRALCLILDSADHHATRQALLASQGTAQCCSLYIGTPAADLANAGPFVFLIDNPEDRRLNELLNSPEMDWGWLASVSSEAGFAELVSHWRDRLIGGKRPHQALYRFHDNRVLSRALRHLSPDDVPGYLGPISSVCYWQGQQWQTFDNPAPGIHPVPETPAWWDVPADRSVCARLREANAHRYLLGEHFEAYFAIADQQDPEQWLKQQLAQADAWGWCAPEQVAFWLLQCLKETTGDPAQRWKARPDETPADHYERIYQEVQFWQGGGPL